jgi:hypothetical protein
MQLNHRPTKVLITGRSGSGKSTYFTRLVLQSRYHYRFVFDHEAEFQARTKYPAATVPEELSVQLASRRLVLYDPAAMFPGKTAEAFAFFCEWAFEICDRLPGTKLFACDELQKLTGTAQVPWEFACILETGRRRGIDLVCISQAPNLVHNRVRNSLTECVTFAHNDENAIAFLEDVGFEAERIRGLAAGQFLSRNLVNGAVETGRVF